MKTFRYFFILFIPVFIMASCKKDGDIGGGDIPVTEKVLSKYDMWAVFPAEGWHNNEVENYLAVNPRRECIVAYLEASGYTAGNDVTQYSTHISFMRFVETYNTEEEAKREIDNLHYIYLGYPEDYTYISGLEEAVVNTLGATKFTCKRNNNTILEENYLIYNNNRLYMIIITVPQNKYNDYYPKCSNILKTFQLKYN